MKPCKPQSLLLTLSTLVLSFQASKSFSPASIATSKLSGIRSNIHHNHDTVSLQKKNISFSMRHSPLQRSKAPSRLSSSSSSEPLDSYDVIIIGSGIGGLSAAAMLTHYGNKVAVFESHSAPGGCAHGYTVTTQDKDVQTGKRHTYHFDTGPSFFSGIDPNIPAKPSNPLRTILDTLNVSVPCASYSTFGLLFPEGTYLHDGANFGKTGGALDAVSGSQAVIQWEQLMTEMEPLARAVDALPTAALRFDVGGLLTTLPFLPRFVQGEDGTILNPLNNLKLTKPFGNVVDAAGVKDIFVRRWLDLLCFCLSGLPADGTISAEMAMMMGEFYAPGASMDCPVGGARTIVDALVRGIEKDGMGKVFVNSHVDKIDVVDGRAVGVTLKRTRKVPASDAAAAAAAALDNDQNDNDSQREKIVIRAKKGVISNLSVWDLFESGIVDHSSFPPNYVSKKMETPVGKSFMHLHVGFEMSRDELSTLQAHYMYIDDWSRGVEAEDNAVLLSIPSVHDNTLAPDGHAVLHIYTPATEDYQKWDGLDRKSEKYQSLKEERSRYLWKVLEKVIPDIRQRAKVVRVGTPLTHKRFLRRYRGSYGPAIRAGEGSFPFPTTPVKGLLLCGDSCFPGIGVPAVAGSGLLAANSVSLDSVKPQLKVLESLLNS